MGEGLGLGVHAGSIPNPGPLENRTRKAVPLPPSCRVYPRFFGLRRPFYAHAAMSSDRPVALVTGANKGIGFAIVRDLCRKFLGDVVLTARDESRGHEAVKQLQTEGLSPRFHQLDIDNPQSIRALRDFLLQEYGGLNVLVNNAGIAFKVVDPTPFHIQAEVTMKTNFFGTQDVCKELLPIIKPQAPHQQASPFCKTSYHMTFVVKCCNTPKSLDSI
nr:carbonyl reductase [NADPH] 1-like isoform X2 [Rattus norvegicus]